MAYGRFVRAMLKEGVKKELAKRYPDTHLRFSVRVDKKDSAALTICAKPIDEKSAPYYMQYKIYTSRIRSFEHLINKLVRNVDWFDDYEDFIKK